MNSILAIDFVEPTAPSGISKDNVAKFQSASLWKARWQLINSFGPYLVLWFAMNRALAVSYCLMLPIAILAAGFLARIFIIFHDCGHGSFFKSKRANNVIGAVAGLLNMTPFRHWRWQHALHHGTAGDLDRRGSGDIWTLTVQEYLQSTICSNAMTQIPSLDRSNRSHCLGVSSRSPFAYGTKSAIHSWASVT